MTNCRDAALSNTWNTLPCSATKDRTRMKTDVEKKNNGRVKNGKGVQKEEGGKTFVYEKRNRARLLARFLVIFTYRRCVLSGAPRAALCGIELFLVRFCGNFFFSKYGIAVFRVQVCGNFKFYDAVIGEKIVVTR